MSNTVHIKVLVFLKNPDADLQEIQNTLNEYYSFLNKYHSDQKHMYQLDFMNIADVYNKSVDDETLKQVQDYDYYYTTADERTSRKVLRAILGTIPISLYSGVCNAVLWWRMRK